MRSEESRGVRGEPCQGVDFFLRAVRNGVVPSALQFGAWMEGCEAEGPEVGKEAAVIRQGPCERWFGDDPGSAQAKQGWGQRAGPGAPWHSEHLLPGAALSPAQRHGTPTSSHRGHSSTAADGTWILPQGPRG